MAKKLSPGEFSSITDWIKQYVGDGGSEPVRKTYRIEIIQPENGTIGCNMTIAHIADPIVCSFTPNEGYQVTGFYVNGEESKLSFAMPAKDITLTGKTEWIIYGTLSAPEISIISKDSVQIIYSVKNPNDAEVKFNGETISPYSALELTHIWGSEEESFLIDGYLEAEHWINSPEVSEIVNRYSQGLEFIKYSTHSYATLKGIGTCTDTDIIVPPTYNGYPVTYCLHSVFMGNKTITSFKSESLTSIGLSCFSRCTSLTSIDLPNVTSIDPQCFYDCTSLTSIDLPNVTSLGFSCFSDCTSLTTINIPNVTSIDSQCFSGCTSLTSINIPNVTTLGDYCFSGCTSLTTLDLPNVTSLGSSCFNGCTSLTTINIPNVTSIDSQCFYDCTSLTSIDLPNVTSLGSGCFYESSLSGINMPNVTSLGSNCFGQLNEKSTMYELTIPSSCTDIGNSFCTRNNVKEIYCYASSSTTKASTQYNGWFGNWVYYPTTIHLLKTMDETSAKEAFGEYFAYNNKGNTLVFDLEPVEE